MFKTRQKGHAGPSKGKKPQAASRAELEAFLQTEPLEKDGVIYIHVPFCTSKCPYCAFGSFSDKFSLVKSYFRAL